MCPPHRGVTRGQVLDDSSACARLTKRELAGMPQVESLTFDRREEHLGGRAESRIVVQCDRVDSLEPTWAPGEDHRLRPLDVDLEERHTRSADLREDRWDV